MLINYIDLRRKIKCGFIPFGISIICSFSIAQKLHAENNMELPQSTQSSNNAVQVKKLDAIIASSTGFDLPLKDEAKNILLLDKEQLQDKGFLNLNQALQYSPFVTFSDNGFGNNIDLRGQGADANRAVKILVNRVPISLLDTSHGVPAYNNIDIEDIERIEIIPGGGAVVYGNGTRGGVVNIVTKAPSKDFTRVVLKAQSGEAIGLQGGSISVAAGKKLSDTLFIRGDVSATYTPGVRNTQGLTSIAKSKINAFSNDNTTNLYAAFQTIYNPSENQKFDFNINYAHLWRNVPTKYLSFVAKGGRDKPDIPKPQNEVKKERNNPYDYTTSTQADSMQTALNYTTKFSESLDFDALAFYQFSLVRYTENKYCLMGKLPDNRCASGIMDMGPPSGFQNHATGINLKVKHTMDNNTLIAGLDNILEASKRTNHVDHVFPVNGQQPPPKNPIQHYISDSINKAVKLSNSIYALDNYRFNDYFDLSAGARLEYSNYWVSNSQTYWQKMQPQNNNGGAEKNEQNDFSYHTQRLGYAAELTPNYRYSDTGNAYAKLELGFISPSAFQMINADPNSSINTNKGQLNKNEANGIKPEQYITAEIGAKDEFDWGYLSATLFYTHTFNEIFVNSITHGTAYTYSNLGQTQRAGLELNAQESFFDTEWLRLAQSVSLLYTNVAQTNIANAHLQGKMVPYVPWLKATFNIEADVLRTNMFNLTLFFNNAYISQSIDSVNAGKDEETQKMIPASSNIMNKGGYLLSDLGIMLSFKDFIKINAGIRNLFDSWYVTYQKYPKYMPGFGRSYYTELKYSF